MADCFTLGGWSFDHAFCCDWEWRPESGAQAWYPLSVVVHDLVNDTWFRYFGTDLAELRGRCPFDTGPKALWVFTHGAGDLQCFLTLEWPLPANVVDTYSEFRNDTNGRFPDRKTSAGSGQLFMCKFYGVPAMSEKTKEQGRQHVFEAPRTASEWGMLLEYNTGDVRDLSNLFLRMHQRGVIEPNRALLQGRFYKAAARIERAGIPVDVERYHPIVAYRTEIVARLIQEVDKDYGVYEGTNFKFDKFERYLACRRLLNDWPRTATGRLDTQRKTFKEQARIHPEIRPLKELLATLSQLQSNKLSASLGPDGRSRAPIWPFSSVTGRNQPPAAEFIFFQPHWMRSLIKPRPGRACAYIDWTAQEWAIAACMSGDEQMIAAYETADPYIALGQLFDMIPPGATKASHPEERATFKVLTLAVNYGMSAETLGRSLGTSTHEARDLLFKHKEMFPRFWRWLDHLRRRAHLEGKLQTPFGWTYHLRAMDKDNLIRNWPVQATGAEMMRLAAIFGTETAEETGLFDVCAVIHDAFFIEADVENIAEAVKLMREAMNEASRTVLEVREEDGSRRPFTLRTDVQITYPGECFQDEKGEPMRRLVEQALKDILEERAERGLPQLPDSQVIAEDWVRTHLRRQSKNPIGAD